MHSTQHNIQDAIDLIDAKEISEGQYIYFASETDRWYVLSEDEIETLLSYMNNDNYEHDAYSHWCNVSEAKAYRTEDQAIKAIRG